MTINILVQKTKEKRILFVFVILQQANEDVDDAGFL